MNEELHGGSSGVGGEGREYNKGGGGLETILDYHFCKQSYTPSLSTIDNSVGEVCYKTDGKQ